MSADSLLLEQFVRKYPALRAAIDFSRSAIATLRHELDEQLGPPAQSDAFIAVSGSVGRLEASSASDLDFMIVYPSAPPENAAEIRAKIEQAIERAEIRTVTNERATFGRPNPRGVFAGDVDGASILGKIGSRQEDYDNLSRRLLLLLESQSLWNQKGFNDLRTKLINAYADDVRNDPSKQMVLLMNDLIRYFRTICVNYHNVMSNEHGKWPIRNVKLRHSRVVMYASLLFCLGELSKYEFGEITGDEKVHRLTEYVVLPPLERFVRLYRDNGDDNLFRFLSLYNNFLAVLADPAKRQELVNLDHPRRYDSEVFSQLKANSDAFASEVTRFLNARRGVWSDRFFEYLIL